MKMNSKTLKTWNSPKLVRMDAADAEEMDQTGALEAVMGMLPVS